MTDLPQSLFANPVWHTLQRRHRALAASAGDACRYPADVAPFAAVAAPSAVALQQLHSLFAPGDSPWLIGEDYPHIPELLIEGTLECLQMVLPEEVTPADPSFSTMRARTSPRPTRSMLSQKRFYSELTICESASTPREALFYLDDRPPVGVS